MYSYRGTLGKELTLNSLVFTGVEGKPIDPGMLSHAFTRLARRKTKLREAAARRKEANRGKKEIRLVSGAPELGRIERGAEATAEARI